MSVNIKVKYLVLFTFIFGCLVGLTVKDLSVLRSAIAKTSEKCKFAISNSDALPIMKKIKGKVYLQDTTFTEWGDFFTRKGWEPISIGGDRKWAPVIWRKCTKS